MVVRVLEEQGFQPSAAQRSLLRGPVTATAQNSPIQVKW